jgi:glycine dehydrogenase subunit 2
MKAIAREAAEDPELVKNAPYTTRVSRLDETAAARKPVLRWKPEKAQPEGESLSRREEVAVER